MSGDFKKILEEQKNLILNEKTRLGLIGNNNVKEADFHSKSQNENCDGEHEPNNRQACYVSDENKENQYSIDGSFVPEPSNKKQNLPFIERLDFSSDNDGILEKNKQAFIDKLINSDNPLTVRSDESKSAMLRFGEYSPNNPQLRVNAVPYLGIGEYDQRRNLFSQRRKAEYLEHLKKKNDQLKLLSKKIVCEKNRPSSDELTTKACQTEIQNINTELVQYELRSLRPAEREYCPKPVETEVMQSNRNLASYRVDQRLTSAQNALLNTDMDKPKSILSNRRTGSPRDRLMSDLQHTYTPSCLDGFSYQSRSDELERERIKREAYQNELRLQIEEKRRLQMMREEQERREQELENRRLEQQLLRMQEEQIVDEQRRSHRNEQVTSLNNIRRHSEDFMRRKQELQSKHGYRKHTDSDSSVSSLRNTNVASKALSHYSPPVSRRNPYSFNIPSTSVFADSPTRYNPSRYDLYSRKDTLNRMDSLNTYDYNTSHSKLNTFGRYDSLSRIDSLNRQDTLNRIESLSIRDSLSNIQRRHSATQQDLSTFRKSPKLQRRSSSSRFDDNLPIPVLKAHSPVAKELKNAIPFNSTRSDAVRKLEDKWQVPAVQKNILNHGDSLRDGSNRSILTQLGAIRMQLQQEQLRMDETLRKRGITQSKAVDFH